VNKNDEKSSDKVNDDNDEDIDDDEQCNDDNNEGEEDDEYDDEYEEPPRVPKEYIFPSFMAFVLWGPFAPKEKQLSLFLLGKFHQLFVIIKQHTYTILPFVLFTCNR
jgi:hypothetical protein